MARQKQWDKYEAAILLDYYLRYLNNEMTRKEAIQTVSKRLRELAKINNVDIDGIYRNTDGITLQMHRMESAYKGQIVSLSATKLFIEIVELYKNDRKQFNSLLEETSKMLETPQKDKSEEFIKWLSKKVSPAQLSELYMSYEMVDEFCLRTGVLKNPFLQTTDIDTAKWVQKVVEQNKFFRFQYKRQLSKIQSAVHYYVAFLKENTTPTNSDVKESTVAEVKKPELPMIRNERDKLYSENYPTIYKEIYKALKESKDVNNRGVTVLSIYEYIGKIARLKTIKRILNNVSWATAEGDRYRFSEIEIDKQPVTIADVKPLSDTTKVENTDEKSITEETVVTEEMTLTSEEQVSFSGQLDLSFTEPTFASYFEEEIEGVTSWRQLYIGVFKKLYEDYEDIIPLNETFNNGNGRMDFCTEANKRQMRVPKEIVDGKFLETNLSATDIVRKIKRLLDICRVDEENLIIRYVKNSTAQPVSVRKTTQRNSNADNNVRNESRQFSAVNRDYNPQTNIKIDLKPITEILIDKFPRGYRLSSPIELRKFKRYWDNTNNSTLTVDDDEIVRHIEMCGVSHDGKLYIPQKMLNEETQAKLFSYIEKTFQSGKSVIYYEALFKEFSDDFLGQCMYNADMLKAYLTHMNKRTYFVNRSFISKDSNVSVDTYDEIKNYLVQQSMPVKHEEIFSVLSHIPEQRIKQTLAINADFISNGKGESFHISTAILSDDELDDISEIIKYAIADKQFIGGNELIESIKKKYPYIIEQNAMLSDKGLRDAIGYRLRSQFSFKGNIISPKGHSLSMMGVFADFCKSRESFTLDELKVLKQELNTLIYFETVYENSLRISKNDFVSKSQAAFNTEETDTAIDRFCVGDYISIKKIEQFGLFPDAGFAWNSYLLEHYVAMYSPNYKLVHSNYNENVCVGAIVKKMSDIDTFEELLIDALAKSGLPLQKEPALQYLCDEGYLARRNYADIEQILIKAKELRNQKGL